MNDEIQEQLRRYAESGAEDAFAAVVQRYLVLVYGAALRRVSGNAHCAEDVAQLVFVALARNAAKLAEHPDLTGWLFTTTRFLAAKALRGERRRQAREQEAYMTQPSPHEGRESEELHAVIDDVVMELRQIDRQLILLRFHRGLRLAEIGAQLEATENAVQKRLDRALEQLRLKLARRGVTSTATALALALGNQSAVAVPAGLAATATGAALACGAGSLLAGTSLMIVSKLQLGLAAVIVAAASSGLVWEMRENTRLRAEVAERASATDADLVALKSKLAALMQRTAAAEADATALQAALQAAGSAKAPPARVVTDARGQADAAMARAAKLIEQGKLQEALDEYLGCYRNLTGKGQATIYQQILVGGIKRLGSTYPMAITALRGLRDSALQNLQANPSSRELIGEVGVLNERLGEGRASMALYDTLPPGDPGRQTLGLIAHDSFVEAGRYADALVGKAIGSMLNELDMGIRSAAGTSGRSQTSSRNFAIKGALSNIEVLTGAGKLDDARMLTEKLLAFDGSDATRAAVKQHVDRANLRANFQVNQHNPPPAK